MSRDKYSNYVKIHLPKGVNKRQIQAKLERVLVLWDYDPNKGTSLSALISYSEMECVLHTEIMTKSEANTLFEKIYAGDLVVGAQLHKNSNIRYDINGSEVYELVCLGIIDKKYAE